MSEPIATPTSPRPPAAPDREALPHGTRFGEFEILRVLGVGGFGVVYLANDYSLERQVALKEYMPGSLAVRGEGPLITLRSQSLAETYAVGLRSFVNEARLLARFDHPSLVKVYRFWEANGTAYMVMPYLQGTTLRDTRRAMSTPPNEAWIRGVLDPMLDALEQLHSEGVFHRDVAPDNILLPAHGGAPILLDFGAARRVISDRTQSLTAILKPSYAPIEQYADTAGLRQGPWTDLYALGAVMHFLLFGAPPAPSTARAIQDDAGEIERRVVAGVSPRFIGIVAWMLGVRPLDRPQNVAQLRAALRGEIGVPARVRRDVTIPGDTALLSVAAPVPFDATVRVDGAYSAPTRVDTAHQPTRLDTAHQPTQLLTPTMGAARIAPASPFDATIAVPRGAPVQPAAPGAPTASKGKGVWIIAGGAAVVAALAVAWQFGAFGMAQARPAAQAAPATAATTATPIVATPDVGPSIANVASVPQWGNGTATPKPAR